jgi:outer membrane lipoprotein carrier protein
MKYIILTTLLSVSAMAHADGLQALEAFVKNARSGRADFTQVVTAPAREGQAARTKTSTGTFEFSRPTASASTTASRSCRPSWPTARPCGCTTST